MVAEIATYGKNGFFPVSLFSYSPMGLHSASLECLPYAVSTEHAKVRCSTLLSKERSFETLNIVSRCPKYTDLHSCYFLVNLDCWCSPANCHDSCFNAACFSCDHQKKWHHCLKKCNSFHITIELYQNSFPCGLLSLGH